MRNKKFYEIKMSKDGNIPEVLIYDVIGSNFFMDGVTAKQFHQDLKEIEGDEVLVRINSPGGSIWEGLAIYNTLRTSDKKIITQVDGMAASMASIIFLAGEERYMAENSYMLIHNPATCACGDEEDFESALDILKTLTAKMVQIYKDNSNYKEKEIREKMDKETMLTSEECSDAGFCTKIIAENKIAASNDGVLAKFHDMFYLNKESSADISLLAENPEDKENAMIEKIIKMLNCDEAGLEAKLESLVTASKETETLKQEIASKDAKIAELEAAMLEQRVEAMVVSKRVPASQKDNVVKLFKADEAAAMELVESFSKTVGSVPTDDLGVTSNVKTAPIDMYSLDTEEGMNMLKQLHESNPEEFDRVLEQLDK